MSRLSEEEKEMLLQAWPENSKHLKDNEFCVNPDLEYRKKYIRFATDASKFFKGQKPVNFEGKHWVL